LSTPTELARLGSLCGIVHGYHDIWGGYHETSQSTLRALLEAMGVAAGDEAAVACSLAAEETRAWRRVLPPVLVARTGEPLRVPVVLPADAGGTAIGWSISQEDGQVLAGEAPVARPEPAEEREIDGRRLRRGWIELDRTPREGYHRLELAVTGTARGTSARLVIAPRRCHLPAELARGERVWGVSLQLYALRSARNWGIGDLGDLRIVIDALAPLGADLVGLNPLHAPFLACPDRASPYSPSSRRFLNPLYLDVEAIEDFAECEAARALVATPDFQARRARARDGHLVQHALVAALKLEVLVRLHAHFREHHLDGGTGRGRAFRDFRAGAGEALRRHAAFEALASAAAATDRGEHAAPHADAPPDPVSAELHEYLQWQTAHQLAGAREHARRAGMRLGLYLDLAVGTDTQGTEVRAHPEEFAAGVSVGAPPDDFSPTGQVWSLPPWQPRVIEEAGYEPFIETLRTAMAFAGALRIDHVIGLMRQFWVPAGATPAEGAYVSFPMRELLAILALESERHGCVVVGEDLGTVPDEMRGALHEHGVLSYRVLYFEKHWHGDGSFKRPQEFPADALVTVSTHDLPTFAGFWSGHDLEVRAGLGLLPGDRPLEAMREAREWERGQLLGALAEQGLAPGPDCTASRAGAPVELTLAVHRYVARTPSLIMAVQIEDVVGALEQVNLPGTVEQQPNWRRRLELPVEAWGADPRLHAVAQAVNAERG
jgi:(1->4)-alpha-D-glucan 1-alpha-D-glucosylmutase